MAKSAVELDFFRMEKKNAYSAQMKKPFERRRSFRDIQGVISKLDPEVLKSVIGSVSSRGQSPNVATSDTAPLTIFYNGTVVVFDLSRDKVDNIMKIAHEGLLREIYTKSASSCSSNQFEMRVAINGDLPIARRKSLQRFLAKRQQRATSLSSPYYSPEKVFSSQF